MAKNKQSTVAALIADSQPITEKVEVGEHTVTIQELTGRERFELGTKEEELSRWDLMLWICMCGIVKPKFESVEELERLKPEWVIKIATNLMRLSGIEEADADAAKNASADEIDTGGS